MRKSGRTIRDDWPQYWDYVRRRGSIYGTVVGFSGNTRGGDIGTKRSTGSTGEMQNEQNRLGLRDEKERYGERSTSPRSLTPGMYEKEPHRAASPSDMHDAPRSSTPFSLSGRTSALNKRASRAPTVIPRSAAITRMDLVASAERIYFRYLSPPSHAGADPSQNHEIYLPPSLRINSFNLSPTREPKSQDELNALAQIPDMFHAQKDYCFRAMEQDAYPRFLRAKAFGNLTPVSALVRLVLGLVILWIGLAVGFSLIFLDVKPKSKRFFVSRYLFFSALAHFSNDAAALHTVHARYTLLDKPSIRTRSHSRVFASVRNYTFPHPAYSGTIRQKTASWARNLGDTPRRCLCSGTYAHILGSTWPSSIGLGSVVFIYLVYVYSLLFKY